MGIRGELYSTRFVCNERTYFFNVKQNRTGDVFLSIVESKPGEGESFDRRSIVVFGEYMDGFLKAFQSALKFIDKTGIKVEPDQTLYRERDGEAHQDEGREGRERKAQPRQSRFRDTDTARRPDSRGERSPAPFSARRTSPYPQSSSTDRHHDHAPRNAAPRSPGGRSSAPRGASSREEGSASKPVRKIVVRKTRKSDSN